MGQKCRLIIVPYSNPDGLARFKPKSLQGMQFEDLRFWGQGTWSDDTFCGWPRSKRQHPMRGENCGFLGCYFNDAGVNAMHDEFFAPMSPEVGTILDLARREAPDIIVSLHSHEAPPQFLVPTYVPKEIKQSIEQLSVRYNSELKKYGIPHREAGRSAEEGEIPPSFNLVSALYHTSGARTFTFECPHGITGDGITEFDLEDILEIQLILYKNMLEDALDQKAQAKR